MTIDTRSRAGAPGSFEDEVRAMLRRRAAGARPSPGARRRMGALATGREVPDEPATTPAPVVIPLHRRPPGSRSRPRARIAAAAVVLLVLGTAGLVALQRSDAPDVSVRDAARDGTGTSTSVPTTESATRPPSAAAPLPPQVDPATAPPLYEAEGDPGDVAEQYLAYQFADGPVAFHTSPARVEGDRATMRWSTQAPASYTGTVRLRATDRGWAVVAATTDQVVVADLHREARAVTVTLTRGPGSADDPLRLRVSGDDLLGERLVAPAEAPPGQAVRISIELDGELPAGVPVQLSADHVAGGTAAGDTGATRLSITDLWVPPRP